MLIAILADDEVPTTEIPEIVREGAQRRYNSIRIQPALHSIRSPSTVRCRSKSSMLMVRSVISCGLLFFVSETKQMVHQFGG